MANSNSLVGLVTTCRLRRLTDQKTRFDYVIASLSPEVATEVRDFILKPPNDTPYTVLKEQFVKCIATSEQCHLQLLFNAKELGDRKPSQLLRRMQQLLGNCAGLLTIHFCERCLPTKVRMVLASTSTTMSLDELAELANNIAEVAALTITAPPPPTQLLEDIQQLCMEVSQLQTSVRTLSHQSQERLEIDNPALLYTLLMTRPCAGTT
jgi:hypothetical protein